MSNLRAVITPLAPYGEGLTNLRVKFTPTQSGTPWQSDEVNNAPYVFRSVPMGNREWNKLVGGTVAWNQLCNSSSVTGTSGHKFYLKKGGAESITNTNTFTGLSNGTDMVIDLTLMLGSTLADYVYSLEQSTAGSGIAWLKKYDLIDDQYHAFSQSSLESVNVSAHVMRDADNNIIETYPIDSSVTLRGMLKTDANGNLYYDGDEYLPDGTVTRKYGYVDLGTLTWSKNDSIGGFITPNNINAILGMYVDPDANNNTRAPLKCSRYETVFFYGGGMGYNEGKDKSISFAYKAGLLLCVKDSSYSDITTFRNSMSGVYLVYELATPTTESADPFTELQVVDSGGTEEYIDYGVEQGTRDFAVPVGHESTYAMAYPIEGVDSFTVTANDGTTHTYPVSIGTTIYKGTVDVLGETYTSEMTNIASYNGETIGEPWLSSLDEYSPGTTPTTGAQVVYTSTPTEGSVTVTGDPTELGEVTSVTSTKGTVKWDNYTPAGLRAEITVINPFE